MKKLSVLKTVSVIVVISCILSTTSTGFFAVVVDENEFVSAQNTSKSVSSTTLPTKYSSNGLGYVTPVKSQLYSDCWAYGGLATFESKLLREGYAIESMSVNHLNAWATKRNNGTGWQRTPFGDGYAEITLGYLTSWQGGAEESDAGEITLSTSIQGDDIDTTLAKYGTTAVEYLDSTDTDAIKRAIMENGGVYSAYASSASCLSQDKLSYYMPESYSGAYTGHAIEIVGWNDNYSTSKFSGSAGAPTKSGAWLVKNSWGDYNSLGGYFWISYEDKFIFGSKYKPSYSIKSVEIIDESKKLVQNEIYGATYEFGYVQKNEMTYINKFDFSGDYRTLDKIIFETTCKNADYTLYYVPSDDNSVPTTDKTQWIFLGEGTVDYSGYICADILDCYLPSGEGSIAVTISSDDSTATIGVGEWLRTTEGIYKFVNDSQYGDSYIYYDDTMSDLLDWYKINNNDDIGGTFVIKAVTTNNGPQVTLLGDANLDGQVNIVDATLIQKHSIGLIELTDVTLLNADYDQNGVINVTDATAIQKAIAGIV
ncbi:MAG: C1 family peptidase [Ruminococcus sp.]|nr:C1 family peptidase [Ruminococcus sp.]